jgi:hypothetical protein
MMVMIIIVIELFIICVLTQQQWHKLRNQHKEWNDKIIEQSNRRRKNIYKKKMLIYSSGQEGNLGLVTL